MTFFILIPFFAFFIQRAKFFCFFLFFLAQLLPISSSRSFFEFSPIYLIFFFLKPHLLFQPFSSSYESIKASIRLALVHIGKDWSIYLFSRSHYVDISFLVASISVSADGHSTCFLFWITRICNLHFRSHPFPNL